jgi:hypothetical protein
MLLFMVLIFRFFVGMIEPIRLLMLMVLLDGTAAAAAAAVIKEEETLMVLFVSSFPPIFISIGGEPKGDTSFGG